MSSEQPTKKKHKHHQTEEAASEQSTSTPSNVDKEKEDVLPDPQAIVKLNVGGKNFQTTASTFRRPSSDPGLVLRSVFVC